MISVSLNVGGGVRLIKPAKLHVHAKHYNHEDGRTARVYAAMFLYRRATRGTSLRELEYIHTYFERNDYIGTSCLRYNIRTLRVDCLKGTTLDL